MAWVQHLSDWTESANPQLGFWSTDHWETSTGYVETWGGVDGQVWHIGYRPTKIRFTVDATTTDSDLLIAFDLQDGGGTIATDYTSYPAGVSVVELDITGQVSDLVSFDVFFDNANLTVGKVTNIEFLEGGASVGSSVGTIESTVEALSVSTNTPTGAIESTFEAIAYPVNVPHGIIEITFEALGKNPISGIIESTFESVAAVTLLPPVVAKFVISTRYLMTLTDTDTSDIYTLPASSLSVSSRSSNPSVINAVIPYAEVYALAIASITHGVIKIYRSQTDSAGATATDLIEYGTLGTIQTDIGPKNASIILTANSTKTNRGVKHVALNGLQYVATVNGKLRVRCTPSNDLTVGDTVSIGDYTLIANNIQLSVTSTLEMMEIYE